MTESQTSAPTTDAPVAARVVALRTFPVKSLDGEQLSEVRRLASGDGAIDAALGKARDHAAKAGDALDGAEDLSPDVCTALTRLVRGLVDLDS